MEIEYEDVTFHVEADITLGDFFLGNCLATVNAEGKFIVHRSSRGGPKHVDHRVLSGKTIMEVRFPGEKERGLDRHYQKFHLKVKGQHRYLKVIESKNVEILWGNGYWIVSSNSFCESQ